MEHPMLTHEEYLEAKANAIFRQLAEEPYLCIEFDPELTDFMGGEEKNLDSAMR